ncbi:phage tail tape measure protein [Loigolactobacillus bifermentans]|uniref:NlpC/P60 domain-containing protein n=1 Tax=Loigolactobacillus bifermentans DSM 20003 TaxID=1423726 RepID=A0A0R1GKD1_9LACO|nr:phage tail tape measure protein [Loigolactobacillus bifermentans]KRK34377.1 hypothetical protein FC07_GL000585 [Loigolactobacillus bifermentans DSM 20003]QGG60081.1 phage tail tape measure protein [Loigolactobacillus bifermentans]
MAEDNVVTIKVEALTKDALKGANDLAKAFEKIGNTTSSGAGKGLDELGEKSKEATESTEKLTEAEKKQTEATKKSGDESKKSASQTEDVAEATKKLADNEEQQANQAKKGADSTKKQADATKKLGDESKTATDSTKKLTDAEKGEGDQGQRNTNSTEKQAQALAKTRTELTSQVTAYRNVATAQETLGLRLSSQVTKLASLRTELTLNSAKMKEQQSTIVKLTEEHGAESQAVAKAKGKYAELVSEQTKLVAESRNLEKAVGGLSPEMAMAADKVTLLGTRMKDVGTKMGEVGSKATMTMTVPIVTAAGAATKAFIDFDSQIKAMGALLDDGHTSAAQMSKQLDSLGAASKKWSTEYGISTTNINNGMTELLKKGYSYNQVLGAMGSILNASKASGEDFNSVMKVSTATLEQFGLKSNNTAKMIQNTQRVTDSLSYVANKTSAGFGDMGEAMEYVGPVAHGLNMSLEQTSAAIGLMSNQGIEGQKAGTALRGALDQLMNPTAQNTAAFKKMGVSVEDFKKGTLTLPDMLDKIKNNTKGWTAENRQAALSQAFGAEAQAGMNILIQEGGDKLRDLTAQTKGATGYTKKLADTMNNTAKANVDKFQQSLHVLAIDAGQQLLPLATDLLNDAKKLVDWFNSLDKGTQKMIINAALTAAAMGPVLSMTSKLTVTMDGLIENGPKLLTWLAQLSPGFKGATTAGTPLAALLENVGLKSAPKAAGAIGEVAEGAAGATPELLGLGGSFSAAVSGLGSLALAAAPAVLAIGGVSIAGYELYKSAQKHEAAVEKTKKSVDEFGVDISASSQKAIKSYNDLHQTAVNDMAQLDTATVSQSQKISADVVSKYGQMADKVIAKFEETKTKGQTALNELAASFGPAGSAWLSNVTTSMNAQTNNTVSKLQKAKKMMSDLLASVGGDFSKLTNEQKTQLQDAENTIDQETSVFGLAYKDQLKLQQAYADQHGDLTEKMLKADLKKSKDSYNDTTAAAKKSYSSQLKTLKDARKNQEITDEQYNQAKSLLDAKRNEQETKAGLEWVNTQKSIYDHYNNNGKESLRLHKSMDDEFTREITDANGKKEKLYWDDVTQSEVSAAEWIENHKKDNAKYIEDQEKAHGTIKKQLEQFQTDQKKAYQQMGLTDIAAEAQAKVDADNLAAQMTKTGSEVSKAAAGIHDSFIKGLKNGTVGNPTQIAKQWGLDITNATQKVDLGKYGTKTAQDFWNDFSSGSQTGYEEAKVYFESQLQGWQGENDKLKDIGKSGIAQLKAGLNAGVVTLAQLKPVFGNQILSLFPKDLSKASDQEIATLKSGLESGTVSLKVLKNRFGDAIYDLFPSDLSSLSKQEIKTLQDGLRNGTISTADLQKKYGKDVTKIFPDDLSSLSKSELKSIHDGLQNGSIQPEELKKKYGPQFEKIFKTDLTKLGKANITTLANGLKAGLPEAQSAMATISKMVGTKATVNLKGVGKVNIASLVKGLESGKISVSQFDKALTDLIKKQLKGDNSKSGKSSIDSYNSGMKSKKGEAQGAADTVRNAATQHLTPDGQPYSHGKKHGSDFSAGILAENGLASGNATTVRNNAAHALTPTDEPHQHGSTTSKRYGQGIYDYSYLPINIAGAIVAGVNSNYNEGIKTSNDLSNKLGGKGNVSNNTVSTKSGRVSGFGGAFGGYAHGTVGTLSAPETAIVGDGYMPELIDYGNGALAMSPSIPTMTQLPEGARVFSGSQTKQISDMMGKVGMPLYAKGTGASVIDWITNLFGDAYKFMTHPFENWNKFVDKSFNMSDFSGSAGTANGQAAKGFEKKQTNWLKTLIDLLMSEGSSGSGSRGEFVRKVKAQEGKPYVWGATGPNSFDCSGLIMWALKQVGVTYPHFSGAQFARSQSISEKEAKTGDLAFYGPGGIEHVAMFIGGNKTFAARDPATGVGYSALHNNLPFAGLRRIKELNDGSKGGKYNESMIKEAAEAMHVHVTSSDIARIQRLIQGESGGVSQYGIDDHDGTGPAKGILQFKDSTFRAYSVGGNSMDPMSALKAFFNDSNWRSDIAYHGWGPTGHRRMAEGMHVTRPTQALIGEVPGQDEFVINPWRPSAISLTNGLLERMQQVQPAAVPQLKLPGAEVDPTGTVISTVTPEAASGFRAVQATAPTGVTNSSNTSSNSATGQAVTDKLTSALNAFSEALSGDVTVNMTLDSGVIASETFPKMQLLLNKSVRIQQTRNGW